MFLNDNSEWKHSTDLVKSLLLANHVCKHQYPTNDRKLEAF